MLKRSTVLAAALFCSLPSFSQVILNHRPVASAGGYQLLGVPLGSTSLSTNLNASGSTDADGDPLTFSWADASGQVLGTSAIAAVTVPLNTPELFVVTVTDSHGASDTAITWVSGVIDQTPPMVNAPFDTSVGTTTGLGASGQDSPDLAAFLAGGSAGDTLDPSPIRLKPQVNGVDVDNNTVFPFGSTTVTFRFSDHSGNIGTADAKLTVADKKDGDIFVGGAAAINYVYGTLTEPGIYLIRGGATTKYCDSVYPYVPYEAMMDREGRIVFFNIPVTNGNWVMFRCDGPGTIPVPIAQFATGSTLLPNIPEAFPGMKFSGSYANPVGGLHLEVENVAAISGSSANLQKRETYVFSIGTIGQNNQLNWKVLSYSPSEDKWTEIKSLPQQITTGLSGNAPKAAFDGGSKYWVHGASVYREKIPLTISASGNVGGTSFNLSLGLFGGSNLITGLVEDDLAVPNVDPGVCPPGQVSTDMPLNASGTFNVMDSFSAVIHNSTDRLALVSNSGANAAAIIGDVSELPFDSPSSSANYFLNANLGCTETEKVSFRKVLGFGASGATPPSCCYNINHPLRTKRGLVSKDYARGEVQQIVPGTDQLLPVIATLGYLPNWGGLTAWPVTASAGSTASIAIQVNSPVDILVTDPNGKRIGVDPATGQPVNDFGQDGFDSGPGEPRFFAVQNPAPGDFHVQAVGTGDGPYSIDFYYINSDQRIVKQIAVAGTAATGVAEKHDFSMGAAGDLQFLNPDQAPLAVAGSDQVVTAGALGTAVVTLDGSQSSDPDGDPLSYQWAGPFGIASGAMPQVTLPAGEHSILLTVNDGQGKSAAAHVVVTVLPPAVTDVTGQLAFAYGAFRYNFATHRFVQVVSVTNASGAAIAGPVSLVLDNLTSGVTLYGATGTTSAVAPLGSPYADLNIGSDNSLAPGESATITLQFADPARIAIHYSSRVLAGAGTR